MFTCGSLDTSRNFGALNRNTEFIYLFIYVTTQETNGELQRKHKYKKTKTNLNRRRKAQYQTEPNLIFCLPGNVIYPYNMNQQDALFFINLFQ